MKPPDFFSDFAVMFEQGNASSAPARLDSTKDTGGAAADYYHIIPHCFELRFETCTLTQI